MCQGDDPNCSDFERHRAALRGELGRERRAFLKSGFVASGGAAAWAASGLSLVTPALAETSAARQPAQTGYHHLPANDQTVHWGYLRTGRQLLSAQG